MLLLVTLVLAKHHGRNAMFLGLIAPGEAQRGAVLYRDVILHLTLLNEVSECVRVHILEDLVFVDGSRVQLPETECSVAARCEDCSNAAAFRHPCIVWRATRRIS